MTQLSLSDADKATLAATDDGARVALLKDLFNRCYGAAPEHVALAGGRVNLIGEHVDYPDVQFNNDPVVHLYSMGGAIQNSYLALVAARSDKKIVLCHTAVGEVFTVELAKLAQLEEEAVKQRADGLAMAERSTPVWANHTLGAVALMISSGAPCEGLSLLLTSNVPPGAGMSNSAANCVALGLVFNELYPTLALDTQMKVVTFARDAENSKFGGGHCGWLDQMLIACSKEHMLTKIDYADHSIEHFTSQLPKETQFVAINTNVPHVLAESDYSHRVRELTVGIAFLSKILGENAGGPLLKLSSLNRLIAAVDPANPASKPVRLENIKMGALAAAAPDGSPKFPSIKAELAEPEPLGHQKIQEIVAAAKGDALRA
ncbi:hypothetical protein EMIHUDRAFT_460056, partial [Emiliania huxleyi CCMP1516]|uniref:Galactokinase n=2 Tax=Emiliania huxleyi TaxID=2903 RepID=A0A0D3I805_EMIH1